MATDPVCKMEVEPAKAAAEAQYGGQTYYFCSESCRKAFNADPRKYVGQGPSGGHTHGGKHQHGP